MTTFPPTSRELFGRPPYLKFLDMTPLLGPTEKIMWRIYVHHTSGEWSFTDEAGHDYDSAITLYSHMLDQPTTRDASITALNKVFGKPSSSAFSEPGMKWCGRCRRPSHFAANKNHHADHHGIFTVGVKRCFFCGIREDYAI